MKKQFVTTLIIILVCLLSGYSQPMELVFNFSTSPTTVQLPLYDTVNVTVDWGDGTAVDTFTTIGDKSHTFNVTGPDTVIISGILGKFGKGSDSWTGTNNLTEVISFGDLGIASLSGAFNNADSLNSVPDAFPSSIIDLSYAFMNIDQTSIVGLDNWDVSNVTKMRGTFKFASNFNQDITGWNVGMVERMIDMFYYASSFDQNIGGWDITHVIHMEDMFEGGGLSIANYDSLLVGWAAQDVAQYVFFNAGNSMYSEGAPANARQSLDEDNNWVITDDGMATAPEITTGSITNIMGTMATASGNITDPGNPYLTSHGICWNETGMPTIEDDTIDEGATYYAADFSCDMIELTESTVYYVRAFAINEVDTVYGEEVSFTTLGNAMELVFNIDSHPTEIKLPLYGTVDVTVDWGDGTDTTFTTNGDKSHVYNTLGMDTITITGTLTKFGKDNDTWLGSDKLLSVEGFGDIGLTSISGAFNNADNLTTVPAALPTGIKNMSYAFNGISQDTIGNLCDWDVKYIEDMSYAFANAENFNQNIGSWNVSSVTNMAKMFYNAGEFNQDIGTWEADAVTDMSEMFRNAVSFNQDIGTWNVGSVTDMNAMFRNAASFNQDIGGWNVETVYNMEDLFSGATAFNQDISGWDPVLVTTMDHMFYNASSFNQDISGWDVSSVSDMSAMFAEASSFDQDIREWDVSSVTNMNYMFYNTGFDQNIGDWDISSVTDMSYMFAGAELSTANYDSLLINWADKTVNSNVTFHGGNSKYSPGDAANSRQSLFDDDNWTIIDGGIIDIAPSVSTLTVTNISATAATGSGNITNTGNPPPSSHGLCWNTSGIPAVLDDSTNLGATANPGEFSCNISNLTPNTTYIVRACASNDIGISYGDTISFTTTPDTIAPTVNCSNTTAYLNNNGTLSIDPSILDDASEDNHQIDTMYLNQHDFDCTNLGDNEVWLYAEDVAGNIDSCAGNVHIMDTITPEITCPNQTVYLNNSGSVSIDTTLLDLNINDNCFIDTVYLNHYDFNCTDLGDNEVWIHAKDIAGNIDSCSTTITVADTISPELVVNNVEAYLDDAGNILLNADEVVTSASDNCSVSDTILSESNFACNDIGTIQIDVIVEDLSGNTTSSIAEIYVIDTLAPVMSSMNKTVYLDNAGMVEFEASFINNGTTDNCSIDSIYLSHYSFSCDDTGANEVWLYAEDPSGNVDSCTAMVTVMDTISPQVVTQNIQVYLDESGYAEITVNDIVAETTDNCSIDTVYLDNYSFNCNDTGINAVWLYADDPHGNTGSGYAEVTVVDTIAPVLLNCPENLVECADFMNVVYYSMPGASDNCNSSPVITQIEGFSSGAAFPAGVTTNTFVAEDMFGNTDTCSFTVTIHEKPNIDLGPEKNICLDESIVIGLLNNTTEYESYQWSTGDTTETIIVDSSSYGLGTNTFHLTVTDANGCTASDMISVTIQSCGGITTNTNALEVNVFPVPATGQLNIQIKGNIQNEDCQIELISLKGQVVQSTQINTNAKENTAVINVENLAEGMYFVKINLSNKLFRKKILIK